MMNLGYWILVGAGFVAGVVMTLVGLLLFAIWNVGHCKFWEGIR